MASRPARPRATLNGHVASLVAILAAALFGIGCGAHLEPSGYLARYDDMKFVDPYNTDLAWAPGPGWERRQPSTSDAISSAPAGWYIAPIDIRPGVVADPELEEELRTLLPKRLYAQMQKTYGGAFQVSSTPPNTARLALAGKYAQEMDIAIVEVRRGFGFARWIFGTFIGASTYQVEGTIRTLPERHVVGRFACRIVHSGDSHFGLNPKALSDWYCLRVSTDWAARDIAVLPGIMYERWRREAEEVQRRAEEDDEDEPDADAEPNQTKASMS